MKTLIIQPRYLPSFEFINRLKKVDVVVFLDNTVIDHRDYENRTKVRCNDIDKWLTIPVTKKEKIQHVRITDQFIDEHRNKVKEYYGESSELFDFLVPMHNENYIQFMHEHYDRLFRYIGKKAYLLNRSEIVTGDITGKEEIKQILKEIDATEYYTGDNCLAYGLDQEFLNDIYVKLELFNFEERFNSYRQCFDLDARYSIVDTEMVKKQELKNKTIDEN